MTDRQIQVTFEAHRRSVFILPGTTLLEAAGRCGLTLDTPCGGAGTCGKCRLQILTPSPASAPTPTECEQFTEDELSAGFRLACQTRVTAPTVVRIPEDSLFDSRQRIVTRTRELEPEDISPNVRKIALDLEPSVDRTADGYLNLLRERIGCFDPHPDVLRDLPARMKQNDHRVTLVLADHELIDVEGGDTTAECFAIAFDVGTTTLVGSLVDLTDGSEQAVTSRVNPQATAGDDVLSRIRHASQSSEHLRELQQLLLRALGEMIDELCSQTGVAPNRVYEITLAGNTTMQQLLTGLDVEPLGRVPFAPGRLEAVMLDSGELGLTIHSRGKAYVFPVIGGFVGGDTVAGVLSGQMLDADKPILLVDVGTNGEIVLVHGGELHAASTAAGPAFEGARISCGMRATDGAIEKVVFNNDVELSVIGRAEPTGACGSGIIDLVAGLLDKGLVSPEGRLRPVSELPASVSAALRARVHPGADASGEFVLHEAGDVRISFTQRDVRELQLAVAAIRTGIDLLLRKAGLSAEDLSCILLAGTFGTFIRRNHAQRIGLLPSDVPHERIHYVGNASLSGAKWALLSTRARRLAEHIAQQTHHVQLSEEPDFQDRFADAMIFPREP